jgi:hypothetical protein
MPSMFSLKTLWRSKSGPQSQSAKKAQSPQAAGLSAYEARVLAAQLLEHTATPADWRRALARAGGLETFAELLGHDPEDPEIVAFAQAHPELFDHAGATALMAAARHNDAPAVEWLLEDGGEPLAQACARNGQSAAHFAAAYASPELAVRLAHAAGRNGADAQGWTPLMAAVIAGRVETVEALLPISDWFAEDENGHAALTLAALWTPEALEPLLAAERGLRAGLDAGSVKAPPDVARALSAHQGDRFASSFLTARAARCEGAVEQLFDALAASLFDGIQIARSVGRAGPQAGGWATEGLLPELLVTLARRAMPGAEEGCADEEDDDAAEARAIAVRALPAEIIETILPALFAFAALRDDAATLTPQLVAWRDAAAQRVLHGLSTGAGVGSAWPTATGPQLSVFTWEGRDGEIRALDALLAIGPDSAACQVLRVSARWQLGADSLPQAERAEQERAEEAEDEGESGDVDDEGGGQPALRASGASR